MATGLREEVRHRVEQLPLDFNHYGVDRFGVSKAHLRWFYTMIGWMYRHYLRVTPFGLDHVPAEGPALLIGNHSGGVPVDAGMVLGSLFFDRDPPIHVHGMVEYFAQRWPFVSAWFNRLGQLPGLPEHALRLFEARRHLLVFPEGARGTGKLYRDRYQLVRFGTGFMRLALKSGVPIIPFAFIGGEEAVPTMFHLHRLARLIRAPYIPVPPQILPIPLPVACHVHYGAPLRFEGDGSETDEENQRFVDAVKARVRDLIDEGLRVRGPAFRLRRVPRDALSAGRPPSGEKTAP